MQQIKLMLFLPENMEKLKVQCYSYQQKEAVVVLREHGDGCLGHFRQWRGVAAAGGLLGHEGDVAVRKKAWGGGGQ